MFPEFNTTGFFVDLLALCFVLLPISILVKSDVAHRTILTIAGAYLIYLIAPRLLLFYAVFWGVIYLLQQLIARTSETKLSTPIFWTSIIAALSPMLIWKLNYEEFSIAFNLILNHGVEAIFPDIIHKIDLARAIIIPIGLSFATFRGLDLLVKTWVGKFEGISLPRILFYGFFPPVQIVGPIIEYEEVQNRTQPTSQDIYDGLIRIAFGLIKVLLIASVLQKSAVIFQTYDSANIIKVWGFLFIYTWFFYLNFSGYSDLAIGISRLLGYKLKENFSFPYLRRNVSEFWNNWHMSLSRFAQRNAFIPLGGYRKKTQHIATLGVIFMIALWHDISWGMVIFALYHGAGLIAHRIYSERVKKPSDNIVANWSKILGTYLFVVLSFPLLVMPLEEAGQFYLALMGVS